MTSERLRSLVWISMVGALIGVLIYTYLFFSETGLFPGLESNLRGFLHSACIGIVASLSVYILNPVLDRWIPWRNHFAARFLIGYSSSFLISFAVTVGLSWILIELLGKVAFGNGFAMADQDLLWKIGILLLTASFIYAVIYALLYSYQHYTVTQIESLQQERKQLELQFEALKSQISPHYLFNSLNTISSLIFNDPPSAEQFIRRLAQTYQYILSTQHKSFVLLREEIDFVQSYYYLLRIRFQQQLTVDINLPSNIMNTKIPPLTLQMLVENAVKHNSLDAENKLFIYISAQDNMYLRVTNTKTGNQFNVSSFKVGLENIQKRYRFFTNQKIEIRNDEKFMISLPVIPLKQSEQRHSA